MLANLNKNISSLNKSIKQTFKLYEKVKVRMHNDACSSLWIMAAHGRAESLNLVYQSHTDNYKAALRTWCKVLSTFEHEGKELQWLSFSQEDGFKVKKGKHFVAAREAFAAMYDETMDVEPFYAEGDTAKKEPTYEDLLRFISKLADQTTKKADKVDASVPQEIQSELTKASAIAARMLEAMAKENMPQA